MTADMPSEQPRRRPAASAWAFWSAAGLCLLGVAAAPRPVTGQAPAKPVAPDEAAFFESKIRPLLIEQCTPCHNKDSAMGGLRLDTRAALLKGGDTGAALTAGDPEKSLLIAAVRHTGKLKMPQGGKLKPEQIDDLATWVRMGAPWPETAGATLAPAAGKEAWRSFWSFQPVKTPAVPAVKNKAWVRNPVDAFVLARLEARGLSPAPPADRRALLRRATYDLTGLPPTPGEMDAFLADKSPDAWEKVVNRLLASPRYGERWARLWMDIARYADTKGYVFVEDRNYPHAYTYRDWLIRSFNEDLPYDKFVTAQIAADRMPEVMNGDDKRPLAALGFLTVGRRFLNQRPDIIDDRIDVTMRGFQGLTVACARCHDHKFDPIPAKDYYSLYGVFDSSDENTPPISPKNISEPWTAHDNKLKQVEGAYRDTVMAQVKRLREMVKDPQQAAGMSADVKGTLQSFRENEFPSDERLAKLEPAFEAPAREKMAGWRKERDELKRTYPPAPELAMAMTDRPNPRNVGVFKRGNPGNQGEEAPRRFLACVSKPGEERPLWKQGSGRLELAQAIASKDNPLTARVFVNRAWQHHFGAGIVRTPSDFGKQGEKPTHPELLDWLAARFMADGWSMKKLHRTILLSNVYRQAADVTPKMLVADPENRLWGRQNRRRLDMEQMRDSLLWAAGRLDLSQVGGKSVELWAANYVPRRSVYGFVERQNLPGIFKTFDFASPDSTSPQRFKTLVPQQGLFLMNSPFAADQARALANLPEVKNAKDDLTRVRRLYLRLYGRLPDADETGAALGFLGARAATGVASSAVLAAPVWQYGYGGYDEGAKRVTGFTPLGVFSERGWTPGKDFPDPTLGFIVLNGDGGHPGNDGAHAAIRRWTAPRDLTVNVAGTLRHPEKQGDGVRARIVSSRTGLLGEWTAHGSEVKAVVANVAVKKGDTLDFVVDPIGGAAFDSFNWSPTIQVSGDRLAWSAKKDFGGPPPTPLTRFEQYAQALLLTNEFLFVD